MLLKSVPWNAENMYGHMRPTKTHISLRIRVDQSSLPARRNPASEDSEQTAGRHRRLSRMRVRLVIRRSWVRSSPGSATLFRGYWSWNNFYGHSLPSAVSRRAVVSFWRKTVHKYFNLFWAYTSLSTICQSYRDGVWMWPGAQCSLLECCLTEISRPRHFGMISHPVTLYWHWADQF